MSKQLITLSEAISRTGSTAAALLNAFPESEIYLDESVIEELKEIREKHLERNLAILRRNEQREQLKEQS